MDGVGGNLYDLEQRGGVGIQLVQCIFRHSQIVKPLKDSTTALLQVGPPLFLSCFLEADSPGFFNYVFSSSQRESQHRATPEDGAFTPHFYLSCLY